MKDIYYLVHKTLTERLNPTSNDEILFIDRISLIVEDSLSSYIEEITEANQHLQDTIKRLTKTGTTIC